MNSSMIDALLCHRQAVLADIPAISDLMDRAIGQLQAGFLTDAEIAASRAHMGLDTQLIIDGSYFLVSLGDQLAGCGGVERSGDLVRRRP